MFFRRNTGECFEIAALQRCMTHEFLLFQWMRHNKNPTVLPLLIRGSTVGFFAFMDLWSQTRFSVCRYRCGNGLGFQRDGRFLRFWVSNRGESALLAHDLCQHKSSVLYLLRPLTLERGCFLAEHTVSSGCRTDGFWRAMRLKSGFVHQTKSGCSGVGGAVQRREFRLKFL